MPDETLLVILLMLPFAGGVAALVLSSQVRDAAAWVAATTALIALAVTAGLYGRMIAGEVVRLKVAWMPAAGQDFTLRMDGLAWMFCLLVTDVGFLVVLYARYYMSPRDPVARFFRFFWRSWARCWASCCQAISSNWCSSGSSQVCSRSCSSATGTTIPPHAMARVWRSSSPRRVACACLAACCC